MQFLPAAIAQHQRREHVWRDAQIAVLFESNRIHFGQLAAFKAEFERFPVQVDDHRPGQPAKALAAMRRSRTG